MRSGHRCASPGFLSGTGTPGSPARKKRLEFGGLIAGPLILGAFRAPAFGSFCATSHLDTFAIHERIGDLVPCLVKIAPRGFPGDPEFLGSLFLLESFEIDETDQLNLVRLERNSLALFCAATRFVAP